MIRKLTLAVGFGAGYVLGAKAGTQRYEQIVAKARELAGMPAVQEFSSNVQQTASSVADKAKDTVNEKVSAVADKAGAPKTTPSSTTSSTAGQATTNLAATAPATAGPAGSTPSPKVVDLATGADTGVAPIKSAAATGTAPLPTAR